MSHVKLTSISPDSDLMFFEQDGTADKASYTFYRGEHANFHPTDESLESAGAIDYFLKGLVPATPIFDASSSIVAFGSCFASHISAHLKAIGYNVATKEQRPAYLATMGEGIVNTYAIRQQFEWAWKEMRPQVALWHGYDHKALGYDEDVRLDTKRMFDAADAFIITLGLSEVWYDAPTGEVFWRAVPKEHFDPRRHKFRVATFQQNLDNIRAVIAMVRTFRPRAAIIFTLSPIPLKATFRPIPCVSADLVSKAALRTALDEALRDDQARGCLYFPSYEIAMRAFEHPFMEDRRHIHKHVLDFNMAAFERYYCKTGLSDEQLLERLRAAQVLDREVARNGHWAVPRANLLFHEPPR